MGYPVDMVSAAIKMFGFLGVILGCLVVISIMLKRRREGGARPGGGINLIRVVQRCQVGVKKSVVALEVRGAVLLVGVGAEGVNLLARLEGEAADLSLRQSSGDYSAVVPFADQLKRTVMAFRRNENASGDAGRAV